MTTGSPIDSISSVTTIPKLRLGQQQDYTQITVTRRIGFLPTSLAPYLGKHVRSTDLDCGEHLTVGTRHGVIKRQEAPKRVPRQLNSEYIHFPSSCIETLY
jgi:hypothetical protein